MSKLAIDGDVAVIVTFARRYPEGRFRIDDETGSVLSLLLVAQDTLSRCAPELAPRVAAEFPPEFRRPNGTR